MVNQTILIEPELSYKVMSVLFKVHSKLGNRLQEKYYQRAIAIELEAQKIGFEKEKCLPLLFEGRNIGKYFLDFVVEDKIIIETKTVPFFNKQYQNQILSYMNQLKVRLGILANFRTPSLTYKRLVLPDKYLIK